MRVTDEIDATTLICESITAPALTTVGVLTSMNINGDLFATGSITGAGVSINDANIDTITVDNLNAINSDINISGNLRSSDDMNARTFFGKISCRDFDDDQYTVSLVLEAGFNSLTILVTDVNGNDVSTGSISMTDIS